MKYMCMYLYRKFVIQYNLDLVNFLVNSILFTKSKIVRYIYVH